jgi:hypothetical protein
LGLPPVTFRVFYSSLQFLFSFREMFPAVLCVSFFISFFFSFTSTTIALRRLHSILDNVPDCNTRGGGQISAYKGRTTLVRALKWHLSLRVHQISEYTINISHFRV